MCTNQGRKKISNIKVLGLLPYFHIRRVVGLLLAFAVARHAVGAPATDWLLNIDDQQSITEVAQRFSHALRVKDAKVTPMLQPGSWRLQWSESETQQTLLTEESIQAVLSSIPGIRFSSPNIYLQHTSVQQPSDFAYSREQVTYMGGAGQYAMNMPQFWSQSRGSSRRVIAILDSGVLFGHPDLQGRLLPGYDFVSQASPATGTDPMDRSLTGSSDGDGRDSDPSDPGDAPPQGSVCTGSGRTDSSFHGTAVASVAAAQSDNVVFLTGIDWNARILPVRVSGRCGLATVADIIDAMYWANGAGNQDPAIPLNNNKADVINLSFAAQEALFQACSSGAGQAMSLAIRDSIEEGVPVVISAGNTGGSLGFPASCPGAIAAASIQISGQIANYSSRGQGGNAVTLYVPGNANAAYVTANNSGTATGQPDPNGHNVVLFQGTSFAAPIVSGLVSVLKNTNTELAFTDLVEALGQTSKPLPAQAGCDQNGGQSFINGVFGGNGSSICGAGAVNPPAALQAVIVAKGDPTANPPQSRVLPSGVDGASLDARLSSARNPNSVLAYDWKQISGVPVSTGAKNGPVLDVLSGLSGKQVEFLLTVTDPSVAQSHSASVLLVSQDSGSDQPLRPVVATGPTQMPETQPQQISESEPVVAAAPVAGGGGGGAVPLGGLLMLLVFFGQRRRVLGAG